MKGLGDFHQAAQDPGGYAQTLKRNGKRILGYFCSYAPEEIIYAAGAHPMRLFGATEDVSLADAHLQAYCCSLVKGGLEEALTGRLDFLDGAVFPHTCDSIQRLSDIWRLNTKFGFFADVVMPVKLNTDSAREYMVDVLKKFRRELAEGLNVDITDEALRASIETFNAVRGSLETIYELRRNDPGCIRGGDLYAIVKGSMVMDRGMLAERLEDVIVEIKEGVYAWDASSLKRLVLAGGVCDHPDIYRIIEESGGVVVYDDLCTGGRWFEGSIETGADPIEAIAGRYLDRSVCPAKHASTTARGERIVETVRRAEADGAVFLLLKFCDPHSFDYPYLKDFLDRESIPNMLYEMEDQLPSEGQLSTRFETFIQML